MLRREIWEDVISGHSKKQPVLQKSNDKELKRWWAQYMESTGEMELALQYYELSEDYLSLVRVYSYCDNLEKVTIHKWRQQFLSKVWPHPPSSHLSYASSILLSIFDPNSSCTVCLIAVNVAALCTCPEIFLQLKFWAIFDISNTRSWRKFVQKHIWNGLKKFYFCGLVDAKIRASDKDLPVHTTYLIMR